MSEPDARRLKLYLGALLRWQRSLRHWPLPPRKAPDAVPFVSLYVEGRMVGCYGSAEGAPGERVARAFLLASTDQRFAALSPVTRASLSAQLSYPREPFAVSAESALATLEAGTHGVTLTRDDGMAFYVLPSVAREQGLDARALLELVARKAGLAPAAWSTAKLALFETDELAASLVAPGVRISSDTKPTALAARWLARCVAADGSVLLERSARTGVSTAQGPGYHARAAVALHALAAQGEHPRAVARARRWLGAELAAALRGDPVHSWSPEPAHVAGALALAVRAGVPAEPALREWAHTHDNALAQHPWYAAQVLCALGPSAPAALWPACVRSLEATPFAPWTLLAARALRDGPVRERAERALSELLRAEAPHRGGASVTTVPELALTAAAVEALQGALSPAVRAARSRAREFLRRWQYVPGRVPASLRASLALGAFPASPVNTTLRCDVTGHALLALL